MSPKQTPSPKSPLGTVRPMAPPPLPLGLHTPPTPVSGGDDDPKKPGGKGKAGKPSFNCAECRRLKIKCNREWPCTSCVKRGCALICPKGEARTGKGQRLILANTEELHQRVSLLETALAKAHAKTTSDPHPLLASSHLYTPRDFPTRNKDSNLLVIEEQDDSIEAGLGILTITNQGEARFVGSFAGSEYLGEDEASSPESQSGAGLISNGMATPPPTSFGERWTGRGMGPNDGERGLLDSLFLGGGGLGQDVEALRLHLPEWETEGKQLVECYWDNVNWMYQILPRSMFETDHLANAYDRNVPVNAHKLASVFFVMAIGVMFDLSRQPFDSRGEELLVLGRAALTAVGLEHPSPATIQALHLYGTYTLNDKQGDGAERFWLILGTAIKIAQSLGLHRDGAAFGLSTYEVEERRQIWWELLTYDRLQALCFGRPCATTNRSSDTKVPDPEAGLITDVDGYHGAKYRLIQMMEKIIDIQTQTTPVSVQQVTHLDKELKDFKHSVPDILMPHEPIQSLPFDSKYHPHLVIHRLGIRSLVAQCRLLLNRPTFARALRDDPEDPSHGRFGESFMALYESAQEMVQLVKQLVMYHPSLIARWWFFWFHAFTASVCLAAIAIRAPSCSFASPAFYGMTIVCDISAAARPGCRAKKGLPILRRLRERASAALTAVGKPVQLASGSSPDPTTNDDDDLSHLNTPAKLRRIGDSLPSRGTLQPPLQQQQTHQSQFHQYPVPQKSNAKGTGNGSDSACGITPPDQDDNSSPYSLQSIATSATLAEPIYYDSHFGEPLPVRSLHPFTGAVPPPPPAADQVPTQYQFQSQHLQQASRPRWEQNQNHNETPSFRLTARPNDHQHQQERDWYRDGQAGGQPLMTAMDVPLHPSGYTPTYISPPLDLGLATHLTNGTSRGDDTLSRWHAPTTQTSPVVNFGPVPIPIPDHNRSHSYTSSTTFDISGSNPSHSGIGVGGMDWPYNMDMDLSSVFSSDGLSAMSGMNAERLNTDEGVEGNEGSMNNGLIDGDADGRGFEYDIDFEMFVREIGGNDLDLNEFTNGQ